jgi:hypothetical protein
MKKSASEIINDLESRITKLERQAVELDQQGNPIWEEFGDYTKKEQVSSVPSKSRGDVDSRHSDYQSLLVELSNALGGNSSKNYRAMLNKSIDVHLFKRLADWIDTVEPSAGHPDGSQEMVVFDVYYSIGGKTFRVTLKVEALLIAGGDYVGGVLLNGSQKRNAIAHASRLPSGEVY